MSRISHKIWVGIMVVVLLLCILIWGFQRFLLEDIYINRLVESVSTDVFQVLKGFDSENPEDTYFELDALAYRRNISVEVINKDGKTIYVTGENPGTQFESVEVKNSPKVSLLAMTGSLGGLQPTLAAGESLGSKSQPTVADDAATDVQDEVIGLYKGAGPESTVGQCSGSGEASGDGTGAGTGDGTGDGTGAGTGDGTGDGQGTGDGNGTEGGEGTDKPGDSENPQGGGDGGNGSPFMPEGEPRSSIIEDALEGVEDSEEIIHPKYGFRLLVLSISFTSKQGEPYVALAAIPLAQIEDIVGLISMAMIASIPLILLIAGLASYAAALTVARPLRKLSTAAEAIGDGDLDARAEVKSKDEVGSLGRTFNLMAERLQKSDRIKREIVENVSHELRTPISVIRGYAETIRDVTGDNREKRNAQLDVISSEANRLGVMVSDILDYSRMTTDGLTLDIEEFDFDSLVRDLVGKYQVLVKSSNITVGYESTGLIRVKGDRGRLEQVIENLMRNAINYSPDGGAVKVILTPKVNRIRVEVRDQGVGIPEEELPMIWERYYRTKGIKKRKIYGSGLGLSIVKSILEAHKATFGVESVLNKGTTFWFELPEMTP